MCGLFGLIDTPWRDSAVAALAALAPRGPDASSLLDAGRATLGHTRLAVIDPAAGQQPMCSAAGRHALVFNGEIYNYRALRRELEALGCVFRTRSDTEVLLHGLIVWGEALLPRLDGMFAFALWDRAEERLYAARDRIGVKPFFYSLANGFAFASTLAPFFRLSGFSRRLDYEALRDFLAFQACLAPHTLLTDVRQLPPASWLSYNARERRFESGRWWEIPPPQEHGVHDHDENENPQDLSVRIDAALKESVRRQLASDVPLGAFLSGGIDSSLAVRYMAEAGASRIKTFSMRFAEEGYDETSAALEVARAFATEHTILEAPSIDGGTFTRAIRDLDQPLADPAYVMTWELARQTRGHVTVALSGDGGDEIFAGYGRFADEQDRFPQRPGQALLRRAIDAGLLPGSLMRRALWGREMQLYRRVELGPWPRSRKSVLACLTQEASERVQPAQTLALWRELAGSFGKQVDTAALMRADLWTYLSENCLAKTDRASMAHGLEVRVPFLGQPVLDATLSLPARVHFDADGGKAILRGIARDSLPEAVWKRKKHGFSVPLHHYFNNAWSAPCEAAIADCKKIAPFLNTGAVAKIWTAAKNGTASRRLAYTLIVLLIWLRENDVDSG